MNQTVLSSYSNFGRFVQRQILVPQKHDPAMYYPYGDLEKPENHITSIPHSSISSFTLKQHFSHERPFVSCKFNQSANKLFLTDSAGYLISVSLHDHQFSTFKGKNVANFAIDGSNSYSLLLLTKDSQLLKLSFQNKKTKKITNLNLNKILAFERNYLREMILALDYKVLMLCDLSNINKIKSIKAEGSETFTNACFASNNRFIILAVKNLQIRIIEIMNMKIVHSVKLPFAVQNLKIEVSFDSKKIAIYGDCPIVFFINLSESQQIGYELIELTHLRSIKQLRYTFQDDLLLLGSDQIIYAIPHTQAKQARLYPIFNHEERFRIMGFDISLDLKTMSIVSNRTIFTLNLSKGLSSLIRQYSERIGYRKIDIISQNQQQNCKEVRERSRPTSPKKGNADQKQKQYQYDDEDIQQEQQEEQQRQEKEENRRSPQRRAQENPVSRLKKHEYTGENASSLFLNEQILRKSNFRYKQSSSISNEMIKQSALDELKDATLKQKRHLYQIISQLTKLNAQLIETTFGESQKQKLAELVYSLYKLFPDFQTGEKVYAVTIHLINIIASQINSETIERLNLILCPDVFSILTLRKSQSGNFIQFFELQMKNLFINYLTSDNWIELVNYLLKDEQQFTNILCLVFISILKQIKRIVDKEGSENWRMLYEPSNEIKKQLSFGSIIEDIRVLSQEQRYQFIISVNKRVNGQNITDGGERFKDSLNQFQRNQISELAMARQIQRSRDLEKMIVSEAMHHRENYTGMRGEDRLEQLLKRYEQIKYALNGFKQRRN